MQPCHMTDKEMLVFCQKRAVAKPGKDESSKDE